MELEVEVDKEVEDKVEDMVVRDMAKKSMNMKVETIVEASTIIK